MSGVRTQVTDHGAQHGAAAREPDVAATTLRWTQGCLVPFLCAAQPHSASSHFHLRIFY